MGYTEKFYIRNKYEALRDQIEEYSTKSQKGGRKKIPNCINKNIYCYVVKGTVPKSQRYLTPQAWQ